jgi:hypothetical protein
MTKPIALTIADVQNISRSLDRNAQEFVLDSIHSLNAALELEHLTPQDILAGLNYLQAICRRCLDGDRHE